MMRRMDGDIEPAPPTGDDDPSEGPSEPAKGAPPVRARLHERRRRKRLPLNSSLWALPLTMGVVALLLASFTGWIDTLVDDGRLSLPSFVRGRSADGARAILQTIAGASSTALALVVTLTVTVLANAGSQFGQRLIRNFMRAVVPKITLGLFVSSTVFSLSVLSRVETVDDPFVPSLSTAVAIALAFASIVALLVYVHTVALDMQVPSVVAGVAEDLAGAVDEYANAPVEEGWRGSEEQRELEERFEREGRDVLASRSGYLQFVDRSALISMARDADVVVRLWLRPGQFLIDGAPMATVWPPGGADALADEIDRALVEGANRTIRQDLRFAVDQMVEVALRALSPGINDLFTGLQCIHWLGDALLRLSQLDLPSPVHRDDDGRPRLLEPVLTFDEIVDAAFDPIRRAGRDMPAVLEQILVTIGRIAPYTHGRGHRQVLMAEARTTLEGAPLEAFTSKDRDELQAAFDRTMRALRHEEVQ
jgi:uncharacterized membrane protein